MAARRKKPPKCHKPAWEPTQAEIAKACEEIRAEWSEAAWTRARRRYGASVPSAQGSYRLSYEVEEN